MQFPLKSSEIRILVFTIRLHAMTLLCRGSDIMHAFNLQHQSGLLRSRENSRVQAHKYQNNRVADSNGKLSLSIQHHPILQWAHLMTTG